MSKKIKLKGTKIVQCSLCGKEDRQTYRQAREGKLITICESCSRKPKYLACIWCGKEITKPFAKYCSEKCRKEALGQL